MIKRFFLLLCVMTAHACLAMEEDDWEIVPVQVVQRGTKRIEEDDMVIVEDQDDMGLTQFFENNEIKPLVVAAALAIEQKREDEVMESADDNMSSDEEISCDSHKKKPKRKKKKKPTYAANVNTSQQDLEEMWVVDLEKKRDELCDAAALFLGAVAAGWSSARDAATQAIMNHDFVQSMLDGISRGGGA